MPTIRSRYSAALKGILVRAGHSKAGLLCGAPSQPLSTTASPDSTILARTFARTMAPHKGSRGKRTTQTQPQTKRTHFVCFPLVTEESIPQLKEALAKFRTLTTSTPKPSSVASGGANSQESSGPGSLDKTRAERVTASGDDGNLVAFREESLRQIPASAHRPPGTFHLTLGVMDLTEQENMDRALRLLDEIDYVDLLREAEETSRQRQAIRASKRVHDQLGSKASNAADQTEGLKSHKNPIPENATKEPLDSLSRAISPPESASRSSEHSALPPPVGETNEPNIPDSTLPCPPLHLTLHGLGTFPSARAARVFFAHVHDESRRLQTFGELVRQRFTNAGLITETRPLVMHATVANLVYVRGKGSRGMGGKGANKGRAEIDARNMIDLFNRGRADQFLERLASHEEAGPELSGTQPGTEKARQSSASELPDESKLDEASASLGQTPGDPESYIWARGIRLDRVRICKMGAEKSENPDWGLEYKSIGERMFSPANA